MIPFILFIVLFHSFEFVSINTISGYYTVNYARSLVKKCKFGQMYVNEKKSCRNLDKLTTVPAILVGHIQKDVYIPSGWVDQNAPPFQNSYAVDCSATCGSNTDQMNVLGVHNDFTNFQCVKVTGFTRDLCNRVHLQGGGGPQFILT